MWSYIHPDINIQKAIIPRKSTGEIKSTSCLISQQYFISLFYFPCAFKNYNWFSTYQTASYNALYGKVQGEFENNSVYDEMYGGIKEYQGPFLVQRWEEY